MRITGPIPDNILKRMSKADRPKGKAGLTNAELSERNAVKLERELHDQVAALLRLRGVAFCHSRMDRKSTITEGWPDFTFAIDGKPCAIECKRPGEKLSEVQDCVREDMLANGWFYCIAYSLDDVKTFLADS